MNCYIRHEVMRRDAPAFGECEGKVLSGIRWVCDGKPYHGTSDYSKHLCERHAKYLSRANHSKNWTVVIPVVTETIDI